MIRWSVAKKVKNWKRARDNLMYIYNWSKAVKYAKLNEKKKREKERDEQKFQMDWGEVDKHIDDYEKIVKERMERMESTEVFLIDRRR